MQSNSQDGTVIDDHPDTETVPPDVKIEDIQQALDFIQAVQNASLENGDLDDETVDRLRNPIQKQLDVSDPDLRHSLDLFLATSNASEKTYNDVRDATLRRHPDHPVLTHHQSKKTVAEMSGVVPIVNHMCPNTCMAYTGPLAHLDACKICGAPRFNEDGPAREFYTIPLGPQLQALFRCPESARDMKYRSQETQRIRREVEAQYGNIEVWARNYSLIFRDLYNISGLRRLIPRESVFGCCRTRRYYRR